MKRSDSERALLLKRFGSEEALRIHVITMSDRAADGTYTDRSGPRLRELVEAFFNERDISIDLTSTILPDDAAGLRDEIQAQLDSETHLIFTTGGTGVGPRDNTPEVILDMADKVIPGIMELVRMKYGADKPCALLSRTVAATMGSAIVYAVPGSTKGVNEYMDEIFKTIEHLLCVVHGLDVH